jgi:hypothetical protein
LQNIIATENAVLLKNVKGLGLKTAQKIIVELSGKMIELGASDMMTPTIKGAAPQNNETYHEALAALAMLGFQIWLGIDILLNRHEMSFSITALFPLAAAFLDFIAARKSLVDEMTIQAVKSTRKANRKRK